MAIAATSGRPGQALGGSGASRFGSGGVVTVSGPSSQTTGSLLATLPDGRQIVVDAGGTALTGIGAKPRTFTFRLLSWATTLPAGSRVALTLAGTSTAQDPANLVYLAAVPDNTHLTIGNVTLTLPVLKTPVGRGGSGSRPYSPRRPLPAPPEQDRPRLPASPPRRS